MDESNKTLNIQEIEKLKNVLLSKEIKKEHKEDQSQGNNQVKKPESFELSEKNLRENTHFHHDFDFQKIKYQDLILIYLNKDYKMKQSKFFPVTVDIKQTDPDTIEICRKRIYYDFLNETQDNKCDEKITIRKGRGMLSLNDDATKREGIFISDESILSKTVKFKSFTNINELIFYQNIYQYKNILEVGYYYKQLRDKNSIPGANWKKNFNRVTLDYHEYLENLI